MIRKYNFPNISQVHCAMKTYYFPQKCNLPPVHKRASSETKNSCLKSKTICQGYHTGGEEPKCRQRYQGRPKGFYLNKDKTNTLKGEKTKLKYFFLQKQKTSQKGEKTIKNNESTIYNLRHRAR